MKNYRSFLLAIFLMTVGVPASVQAQNITPLLDCIEYDAATNTVTAHLGYDSRETNAITQVLIGSDNRFVPNPANRGQNILFLPGLHQRAFSTAFPGNSIEQWLLLGQALTLSHNLQFYCRRKSNQIPTITPIVTSVQLNGSNGQATATFGYLSSTNSNVGKGSNNYVSFVGDAAAVPYPGDRGQPTNFQAGLVRNAFQVTFNPATESAIAWNLLGQTVVAVSPASPQSTVFTYQGRLSDASAAANGAYDLQFALYDAATGGTQQPQPSPITVTRAGVQVTNGVFTVQLDFGAAAFPGADRYLEIRVKRPEQTAYTTLSPRQQITSVPYAIRSLGTPPQ